MAITKLGKVLSKAAIFNIPRKAQFPQEAYIPPGDPAYDPKKSHYDIEGDWVGDITAAEAADYWKARARDFE